MPICLLLQGKGSFMCPFLLNDEDPMFTLLVTYVKSKCDQNYFNYRQCEQKPLDKSNILESPIFKGSIPNNNNNDEIERGLIFSTLRKKTLALKNRGLSEIPEGNYSPTSILKLSFNASSPNKSDNEKRSGEDRKFNNNEQYQEMEENFNSANAEEDEQIVEELIRVVELFFNKLNAYSRNICFQSKFSQFRKRFKEFVYFVSDNCDLFELLELNMQVNIHKISLSDGLENDQSTVRTKRDSINSLHSIEENYSTVTVLPCTIKQGSIAEKQFETMLQQIYQRKKDENDFEYKVSLIFSKNKIYEFDKQFVQKMKTINGQLQWICQPQKNQVKILMQHAQVENNNDDHLGLHHKMSIKKRSSVQKNNEDDYDSNEDDYEIKEQEVEDEFILVDFQDRGTSEFPPQQGYFRLQNNQKEENSNRLFSTAQASRQITHNASTMYQQDEFSHDDLKRKISAMSYSYMYELLPQNLEEQNNYSEQTISCLRHVKNHMTHSFSIFKSQNLQFRPMNNKYINNGYLLRINLFILLCLKIIVFWFLNFSPLEEIILGESNAYSNIVFLIQNSIYPFAPILCSFYQLIWVLRKDVSSGKKCLILNAMQLVSAIILITFYIPEVVKDQRKWMLFLYNTFSIAICFYQGFIGGIFLAQNSEKQINFHEQ